MDLTSALRTFVRVVERGSLTGAARDLGVSQPAVSKLIRNLELQVGARLLERSARALRPTTQGLTLYERSGGAIQTIDAALDAVRGAGTLIDGRLRVHGPACVGERHLNRILFAFQDEHPAVSVELRLDNHTVDLIEADVDIAFQMGRPTRQDLIARRVGSSTRILVASPDYLDRRGPIRSARALGDHDLVVTDASLASGSILSLVRGAATVDVEVRPKLTTNSATVLVDALRAGRGIGTAQVLLVADDLKAGRLIRVLPRYQVRAGDRTLPDVSVVAFPAANAPRLYRLRRPRAS